MKWRWLAVAGVAVLLMGCHERFPICPHPGGVIQKVQYPPDIDEDKGGSEKPHDDNCYWLLTITRNKAKDPNQEGWGHDVWAKVSKTAVLANAMRLKMWRYDYKLEDYYFHEYPLFLSDPNDMTKLDIDKDYYFVGSPGSPRLTLTSEDKLPAKPEGLEKAQRKLKGSE